MRVISSRMIDAWRVRRSVFLAVLLAVASSLGTLPAWSADDGEFLAFVKAQAEQLRANDRPALTREEWKSRRERVRTKLLESWGGFPAEPCPLEAKKLGELKYEGYRVEKIIFQTMPNVWMTANAYVPEKSSKEKVPAVLCVHGHWAGAKQDPVVQARCIGLVKHGFFVLSVDALGAGERAIGKALGEYHGEMTGALLLPIGRPLAGLQVYENMRAVDYLATRPEVDAAHVGITGASGGGNQSMYAGTFDTRFGAAVPVCSVGNYRAYLGAACCMCEVVPGALSYTEEGDLLALAAPRGLMVINATRDARQFSVDEAKKSIARASEIFRLLDSADHLRHTIIDSGHDYNQPMREAMYGWMTRHLKGQGDGSPLPDPKIETVDRELLRCYPGDSRPDDYTTIARFASAEGQRLVSARGKPNTEDDWKKALNDDARLKLAQTLKLPTTTPAKLDVKAESRDEGKFKHISFVSETGIRLSAQLRLSANAEAPLQIVLDLQGAAEAEKHALAAPAADKHLLTIDLRATGKHAITGDTIAAAPDHNSAEWSLWIGRPLLGQWVHDVRRALDAIADEGSVKPSKIIVAGVGPAGLVALASAALDERISEVVCSGTLASYVSDRPYRGQRLGTLVPGILRDVGDVGHIAALIAPRPLTFSGGVLGGGETAGVDRVHQAFDYAIGAYQSTGKAEALRIEP